jgi:RNA polymerase sporulation-specific sigma factor
VEENSALIWSVVRRYYGRGVEPDDLYQLGCLGFVKAVQGFDLNYGTEFSTYAVPKIGGEIRRFLRDDGVIKVGRTLKQQSLRILAAREKLRAVLGREPCLSELEAETGLRAEEIAAAEASAAAPESLQQETGEGLTLESMLGTDEPERQMLRSLTLRQAIETLPEKERTIIALRYFRAYTQQECAAVVKLSQVQVSRLEKRALKKLRGFVEAE